MDGVVARVACLAVLLAWEGSCECRTRDILGAISSASHFADLYVYRLCIGSVICLFSLHLHMTMNLQVATPGGVAVIALRTATEYEL